MEVYGLSVMQTVGGALGHFSILLEQSLNFDFRNKYLMLAILVNELPVGVRLRGLTLTTTQYSIPSHQ
jgi:hypothetical protein